MPVLVLLIAGGVIALLRSPTINAAFYALLHSPPDELVSISYDLDRDHWLRFHVNSPDGLVRLFSAAQVPSSWAGERPSSRHYEYAIDYELYSLGGELLDRAQLFFRGKLRYIRRPGEVGFRPAGRYLDTAEVIPTMGQSVVINLAETDRALEMRFRLSADDPSMASAGIDRVSMRLYVHQRTAGRNLEREWQRLSRRQKLLKTREFVTPPEFIETAQRTQIMRQTWQPLGPEGVEGPDYFPRSHAVDISEDSEVWRGFAIYAGIPVDADHDGVVFLPGGEQALVVEAAAYAAPRLPFELRLKWLGEEVWQYSESSLVIDSLPARLPLKHGAGWLQLSAAQAVTVQLKVGPQMQDKTPELKRVWAFPLHPTEALEFPVNHYPGEETQVKILSRLFGVSQRMAQATWRQVRIELLDAQAQRQQVFRPELRYLPSRNEFLKEDPIGGWVSAATETVMQLREDVTTVRVLGPPDVLVSMQTRPQNLPFQLDVPAAYRPWLESEAAVPLWFQVNPEPGPVFRRAVGVLVGPRLPQRDADLQQGKYAWSGFEPSQANWLARSLWTSRESGAPRRDEARSELFDLVPQNLEHGVAVVATISGATPRPEILYLGTARPTEAIQVWLDGRLLLSRLPTQCCGTFRLPALQPGAHQLRVIWPDGQVYLNSLEQALQADAQVLKRVRAFRTPAGDAQEFSIDLLPERSALSLRIFHPETDLPVHCAVDLEIKPAPASNQILSDLWVRKRRFKLSPGVRQVLWASGHSGLRLIEAERLIVPVPAGAADQQLLLSFRNHQETEVYLSVSRVQPGEWEDQWLGADRPEDAQ